jgi:hypothetical protein
MGPSGEAETAGVPEAMTCGDDPGLTDDDVELAATGSPDPVLPSADIWTTPATTPTRMMVVRPMPTGRSILAGTFFTETPLRFVLTEGRTNSPIETGHASCRDS